MQNGGTEGNFMFGAESRGFTGHLRVSYTHVLPRTAHFKRWCLMSWFMLRSAIISEFENTQKMVLQGHAFENAWKRYLN